ncbi:MAG: hypothetical protein AUH85_06215 [Chloroflexi bacterium 13_1_40CM_4_68_4]|nr:MAG: hypothetical protein AUH85_06215 [Chloroflexi bacterium 13_1_40CM_4_68_4]
MSAVVTRDLDVAARSHAATMPRLARRLAWALWLVAGLLAIASILVVIASLSLGIAQADYLRGSGALLALGYATIGARIAARHPKNAVGWLIIATGIAFGVIGLAQDYIFVASAGGRAIGLSEGVVRAIWVFNFAPSLTGSLFLLLFPDGRFVSRLGFVLAAFAAASNGIGAVIALVVPLPSLADSANPIRDAGAAFSEVPLFGLVNVGSTVALALSAGALLLRLLIAHGDERQQLKWVAAAGIFAVLANLALNLLGILSFPVAAGIAMQRYRLYDIDTILNRTLVYVLVTAFLAGLTAALLGSIQRVFIAVTGQSSEAAIVVTTLILVAVFTPLRDLVQRSIDARLKAPARGLKGLRAFTDEVSDFAHFTDRQRLIVRLLAESAASLDAIGGAAEIGAPSGEWSTQQVGRWNGDAQVTATINEADGAAARIRLGPRRDGEPYSNRQLAALRAAAGAVADALTHLSL